MSGAVNLLEVEGLNAWQRDVQVLFDIHLRVPERGIVALIGANGAGKSSLLDALAGLALVPEGRRLFASLTVEENLLLGAASRRPGHWTLDTVYGLFPALEDKRHAPSHALSGGQQQQVAIGRGLMSNPLVLLCDEISLGLSPAVVRSIYAQLGAITDNGTGVVLVEQNIALVLQQAQYVHVLREGKMVLEGAPADLSQDAIRQAYFGVRS